MINDASGVGVGVCVNLAMLSWCGTAKEETLIAK